MHKGVPVLVKNAYGWSTLEDDAQMTMTRASGGMELAMVETV